MINFVASNFFVDFLNGNIFGYLLHAGEVIITELLFAISLKKRRHFAYRLIFSLIIYFVLAVLGGLFFEKYFSYARYIIAFLLSIAVMVFCYGANIWDTLFCIVAAIATQNLGYSTSAFVVGLFGWDPLVIFSVSSIVQVIIYIAIHAVVYLLCVKKLQDISGAGEERIAMIVLSLALITVIYVLQIERQSLSSDDFLLWRAMFISYDMLMLFMLFGMYDRNKLRRENAILDSLRASEEKQYELDKRAVEAINIKCHDLKHQLIALRGMTGNERDQAFNDIEEAVLIYDSIAKTGCKPLDVILSSKYLLCERYGIAITYMIDGGRLAFMKSSDIYSLFGNALDNAIRAERAVEDKEKRLINVSVVAKGRFLIIHMENYCDNPPVFKDGLPVTTQNDTENHGFGMLSMKRIVESYGGVMSVGVTDDMFCVNMTIPIKTV